MAETMTFRRDFQMPGLVFEIQEIRPHPNCDEALLGDIDGQSGMWLPPIHQGDNEKVGRPLWFSSDGSQIRSLPGQPGPEFRHAAAECSVYMSNYGFMTIDYDASRNAVGEGSWPNGNPYYNHDGPYRSWTAIKFDHSDHTGASILSRDGPFATMYSHLPQQLWLHRLLPAWCTGFEGHLDEINRDVGKLDLRVEMLLALMAHSVPAERVQQQMMSLQTTDQGMSWPWVTSRCGWTFRRGIVVRIFPHPHPSVPQVDLNTYRLGVW